MKGKLWQTTTLSKPLTVRNGEVVRFKDGIAEVIDKDSNVIESCTYEVKTYEAY